jgi:LacI family transcriptional regulator
MATTPNASCSGANETRGEIVTARRTSRQRSVSLRDVAERANVSTATVSRTLSNSDHAVRESTRQAVLDAAAELGFEPNRLARSLVTSRSQVVGVIVHDISDPYFGDIVRGLEDELSPADYRLLIASTDRDAAKELAYLRALMGQQVDAIVLAASSINAPGYREAVRSIVVRYQQRGGVVVLLSDHVVDAPRVHFDNRGAARTLVEHLVSLGHVRIAHLSGSMNLETSRRRFEGYRDALLAAGLDYDESIVVNGEFTLEGGRAGAEMLRQRGDFTALFASNDLMAIGATRGLLDAGVSVPDGVSVAGFDDINMAAYAPVPLTTMRLPSDELGKLGARLVLAELQHKALGRLQVESTLIERDSVSPTGR